MCVCVWKKGEGVCGVKGSPPDLSLLESHPPTEIWKIHSLAGTQQQWVAILDLSGSGHLNFNGSKVGEADTVKYDA